MSDELKTNLDIEDAILGLDDFIATCLKSAMAINYVYNGVDDFLVGDCNKIETELNPYHDYLISISQNVKTNYHGWHEYSYLTLEIKYNRNLSRITGLKINGDALSRHFITGDTFDSESAPSITVGAYLENLIQKHTEKSVEQVVKWFGEH